MPTKPVSTPTLTRAMRTRAPTPMPTRTRTQARSHHRTARGSASMPRTSRGCALPRRNAVRLRRSQEDTGTVHRYAVTATATSCALSEDTNFAIVLDDIRDFDLDAAGSLYVLGYRSDGNIGISKHNPATGAAIGSACEYAAPNPRVVFGDLAVSPDGTEASTVARGERRRGNRRKRGGIHDRARHVHVGGVGPDRRRGLRVLRPHHPGERHPHGRVAHVARLRIRSRIPVWRDGIDRASRRWECLLQRPRLHVDDARLRRLRQRPALRPHHGDAHHVDSDSSIVPGNDMVMSGNDGPARRKALRPHEVPSRRSTGSSRVDDF